jgi:hypothetical protein
MRATVVLSLVMLSGCASSNAVPGRPTPNETVRIVGPTGAVDLTTSPTVAPRVDTIPAPLDQVWRMLPAAYDSLAIPLTNLDAANHVVGNAGLKVRGRLGNVPLSRYLDCGDSQGAPSAETYEVQLSMFTQVYPGSSGTATVTTTVQASGRPVAFSGEYVRCTSKGALEARLASSLKAQLSP